MMDYMNTFYFYRRNIDVELRELERQALADPDNAELVGRYLHALARATEHDVDCDSIKYSLDYLQSSAAFEKVVSDYIEAWPDYCKECSGWGGHTESYDPSPAGVGLSSGGFPEYEPCETCVEAGKCPRCGEMSINLIEDDRGDYFRCSECDWSDKNGTKGLLEDFPEPPECNCRVMRFYE